MTTKNITPDTDQLATMREISGFLNGASEARSAGYIAVPDGITPQPGDQVVVRTRGNQWRRGVVLDLGRSRIVVGTFNATADPVLATRVQSYTRDRVMLRTWPCERCHAYIHPVYDTDNAVDINGNRFCSDGCLYLHHAASRQLVGAGS
jgi:hypothetical protein